MRKCLLLLLLPFLAASLSVTNLRAKRGAVIADEEPTVHRDEAERGALHGSGDSFRWRRSLPSLTAPWTSVVEELSRDLDTEIHQHVQVRKLPSLTVVIPSSGPAGRQCLLHVPHVSSMSPMFRTSSPAMSPPSPDKSARTGMDSTPGGPSEPLTHFIHSWAPFLVHFLLHQGAR